MFILPSAILITIIQTFTSIVPIETVSLGRLNSLTREQFLDLDREVSRYYNESYWDLDGRKPAISYDEQLFRSIRSIRHTVVLNLFDFKYSRNETKWNSMGSRVDRELCRKQLRLLAQIANKTQASKELEGLEEGDGVPLSIVDFLEASGTTGSGVLNGNFVWLGSYNSCLRSRIPANLWRRYLGMVPDADQQQVGDIQGRYCVAHLRAKSWPKWDDYFEDRLTIKRGVCLPEVCHTAIIEFDDEMERLVDIVARVNLLPPFNGDRYETSGLYCLPDEDSPFRQMDLGARLFIVFVVCWILVTIYTNVKYYKRLNAVQKLRETVDIRMIINEKLDDIANNYRDDDDNKSKSKKSERDRDRDETRGTPGPNDKELELPLLTGHKSQMDQLELVGGGSTTTTSKNKNNLMLMSNDGSAASSTVSSVATTPLPSGIDEDDSDITDRLIEPFSQRKRKRKRSKKAANYSYATNDQSSNQQAAEIGNGNGNESSSESLDFIKAFSFEANLNFLFKPRPNVDNETNNLKQQQQQPPSAFIHRGSQQLATVARRNSSLNEALVKDLQLGSAKSGAMDQASKVAIVSGGKAESGTIGNQAKRDREEEEEDHEEDQAQKRAVSSSGGDQDRRTMSSSVQVGASESSRRRRVNIDVLDGMKVIATSWIVWGHTMMFFFGLVVDMRFGPERMFDITMISTINTLQVVGLFYIITGCLLTYFSFNKAKLKQLLNPIFWLLVLIGRYVRLVPAYALVFWFARHVAPHTGYGPGFYDYRTDDEHARGACANESWWVMWTMSAADIKIPMDCIPQAWYLSDDFRTLLVLPIYVFLLAKSTLLGYSAIFVTFVYSNFKLAQILQVAKIDYRIVLNWQPHVYALMADRLHEVYTDPAVRMSTYLLGVIVGHLLYLYETGYIKQWPAWFRAWAMKFALLLASCFFLGAPILASPYVNQFLPTKDDIDSDAVVWLIPLFKSAMELSICVMVLLLVTGGGFGFIRRILASQAMKILSNISYAVFLTHVEIMYKLPAHQMDSDYWHLYKHAIFFIVIAHIISFFIHLFFEMPVHNLTRHLFKRAFKIIS
uniref:Nose resistant to fluoxetine protein 6 n=1 Tax=Aceria tosichella TaxID=561515 RepID=A0A6G1SPM1_9ACAR